MVGAWLPEGGPTRPSLFQNTNNVQEVIAQVHFDAASLEYVDGDVVPGLVQIRDDGRVLQYFLSNDHVNFPNRAAACQLEGNLCRRRLASQSGREVFGELLRVRFFHIRREKDLDLAVDHPVA